MVHGPPSFLSRARCPFWKIDSKSKAQFQHTITSTILTLIHFLIHTHHNAWPLIMGVPRHVLCDKRLGNFLDVQDAGQREGLLLRSSQRIRS